MINQTAGELALKAASDQTVYDSLEVGHSLADDIGVHLEQCIRNHIDIIDEPQFCVVMLIAKDNMIPNAIRRKFYAWPYLPKPRPNQAVFLFDKRVGRITKRLWVLPCAETMAYLASTPSVCETYETMQAWSIAFFQGTFWHYIRHEHGIDMLSEHEYALEHREELIKSGCQIPTGPLVEPFDFSKIHIKKVVNSLNAMVA